MRCWMLGGFERDSGSAGSSSPKRCSTVVRERDGTSTDRASILPAFRYWHAYILAYIYIYLHIYIFYVGCLQWFEFCVLVSCRSSMIGGGVLSLPSSHNSLHASVNTKDDKQRPSLSLFLIHLHQVSSGYIGRLEVIVWMYFSVMQQGLQVCFR